MGWEVHFNSYEKNKDGKGYDMESPSAFKKQIGKMEEVPLEKVAAEIVKQMARRDILVEVDKIFEYTKKEVSFRESKGAVVIKGQKFNLDGLPVETSPEPENLQPHTRLIIPTNNNVTEAVAEIYNPSFSMQGPVKSLRERLGVANSEASVVIEHPSVNQQPSSANNSEAANLRILRMECFDPDDANVIVERLGNKGMSFTVGKRYPIFRETPKEVMTRSPDRGVENNVLLIYKVSDDNGKMVEVPSTYFRMPTPGLTFMGPQQQQAQIEKQQHRPRLLYMGEGSNYGSNGGRINVGADNGQMVSIRRGA